MGFSLKSVTKNIGGAIGAVAGSILGGPSGATAGYTIGNSLFGDSSSEAKDLYKWQLQQQNANNIYLWNMQNAYNTPKAQMERFKEAGLNPNLIYGQTNTASPISSASANFSLDNTQNQKSLSNYLALSNLGMQKDLSSAQVRNIDNSIDMSRLNYGLEEKRLQLENRRLKLSEALLPYQIAQIATNNDRIFGVPVDRANNFYDSLKADARDYGGKVGEWIGDKAYSVYKWFHTGERNKRWYY